MSLDAIRRTLDKALLFNEAEAITEIINTNQEFITALLKQQLASGKDGNDEVITIFGRDTYSLETIINKRRVSGLGGETRWITNYMSGDFYSFLFVEAKGTSFEFFSDVEYFPEIIFRSDSVIMELNQEHIIILRQELILPELRKKYQAFLNGV